DQDSCELIERILRKEGYRVGTLTDPRKVEDELRKNDVHLAIVDLKMPEMSGLDVAQIIKRHDSDCSVILMTGYATLDSALRALGRNKLRSALAALAIMIGIGAVVCVVAIGRAGSRRAEEQLQNLGDNFVWIEAGSRAPSGVRTGSHGTTRLTVADAQAIGG